MNLHVLLRARGPEPEASPLVSQGIDRFVSQKPSKSTWFPAFPHGTRIVVAGQSQGQPWRKVGGKLTHSVSWSVGLAS
jgi:hypothetical protein